MNVTQASLTLEIDGQTCMALLDQVDKNLLVRVVAQLVPDGLLKVVPLADDFKWESFAKEDYKKDKGVKP